MEPVLGCDPRQTLIAPVPEAWLQAHGAGQHSAIMPGRSPVDCALISFGLGRPGEIMHVVCPGQGRHPDNYVSAELCRHCAGAIGGPEVCLVITAAKLKTRTVKDLAAMAKKKKIAGWHSMRKDELIRALIKHAKAQAARRGTASAKATAKPKPEEKPRNTL